MASRSWYPGSSIMLSKGEKVPGLSRAANRDQSAYDGRGDGLLDTVPSFSPQAALDLSKRRGARGPACVPDTLQSPKDVIRLTPTTGKEKRTKEKAD